MSDPITNELAALLEQQGGSAGQELRTGRGPTGRLRNFKSMNDGKFAATLATVVGEANDPEALAALEAEAERRRNG